MRAPTKSNQFARWQTIQWGIHESKSKYFAQSKAMAKDNKSESFHICLARVSVRVKAWISPGLIILELGEVLLT